MLMESSVFHVVAIATYAPSIRSHALSHMSHLQNQAVCMTCRQLVQIIMIIYHIKSWMSSFRQLNKMHALLLPNKCICMALSWKLVGIHVLLA